MPQFKIDELNFQGIDGVDPATMSGMVGMHLAALNRAAPLAIGDEGVDLGDLEVQVPQSKDQNAIARAIAQAIFERVRG